MDHTLIFSQTDTDGQETDKTVIISDGMTGEQGDKGEQGPAGNDIPEYAEVGTVLFGSTDMPVAGSTFRQTFDAEDYPITVLSIAVLADGRFGYETTGNTINYGTWSIFSYADSASHEQSMALQRVA